MNNFETIIGIEIHTELNTKTKMFSSAPNNFDAKPNTNVNEVDIAYPGTLPQLNKGAVIRAIKLAKALKMNINDVLRFDRKNYFYPDLPKGFQITQADFPIGFDGQIEIDPETKQIITLERIHLEEDTAKSLHEEENTLLNYNRAGVPLIEIVSNPDMHTAKEAKAYVSAIRDVLLALNISDAKMEEGSLRADINISLRPRGQKEFGTKVEIKNMNSINNIEKAIAFEIALQTKALIQGEVILQATKRFDEATQETVTMRVKTDSVDYKFFPEPNIPLIKLEKEFIDGIKLPELPWEIRSRYESENIPEEFINKLMTNFSRAKYFDSIDYKNKEKLVKVFFAEVVALANQSNKTVTELNIDAKQISLALAKIDSGEISAKHLKSIIPELVDAKQTVDQIVLSKGMKQISDEKVLNEMIISIIESNKDFIEQNNERKERVVKFVLGQVMKQSKGQANPLVANKLVKDKIGG